MDKGASRLSLSSTTGELSHFIPEFSEAILAAVCHIVLYSWHNRSTADGWLTRKKKFVNRLIWLSGVLSAFGLILQLPLVWQRLPEHPVIHWLRGGLILWAMVAVGSTVTLAVARYLESKSVASPNFHPGRRQFLTAAQAALVAAPAFAAGFGVFIERRDLRLVTKDLKIPGLPKDLNGLQITQVSDIHLSAFLSEKELAYAIDMANETKPHLMVMTGDLITRGGDPLDACIRQLGRLKADLGVYGCNGNHEVYAKCEGYVERECSKVGVNILRHRNLQLKRGNASINLAGVDYQTTSKPLLTDAGRLLHHSPETLNLLLSHNPGVFEKAAEQGWDLTLSGHTHGGQVSVEILHQHMNIARFYTPYVYGDYEIGDSRIFVTRGIGTVALPARIGAPPEIAAIRLWST